MEWINQDKTIYPMIYWFDGIDFKVDLPRETLKSIFYSNDPNRNYKIIIQILRYYLETYRSLIKVGISYDPLHLLNDFDLSLELHNVKECFDVPSNKNEIARTYINNAPRQNSEEYYKLAKSYLVDIDEDIKTVFTEGYFDIGLNIENFDEFVEYYSRVLVPYKRLVVLKIDYELLDICTYLNKFGMLINEIVNDLNRVYDELVINLERFVIEAYAGNNSIIIPSVIDIKDRVYNFDESMFVYRKDCVTRKTDEYLDYPSTDYSTLSIMYSLDPLFFDSCKFISKQNGAIHTYMLCNEFHIGEYRASYLMQLLDRAGVVSQQYDVGGRLAKMNKSKFESFMRIFRENHDEGIKLANSILRGGINNTKSDLRKSNNKIVRTDGYSFENVCADLLRNNGYENVEVTKQSGDQGIDVIANRDGVRYGIQCKYYTKPVGNSAVQEALSGKAYYECHVAIVMTNNVYTNSAIELAKKNGVVLWDGDKLKSMGLVL